MNNDTMTIQAIVSGKVQGVFYRKQTQALAQALQLEGYAKNCPDGSVEIKATGHRDHIMELTEWLWQGPDNAEVMNVHWEEVPTEKFDGFDVL